MAIEFHMSLHEEKEDLSTGRKTLLRCFTIGNLPSHASIDAVLIISSVPSDQMRHITSHGS